MNLNTSMTIILVALITALTVVSVTDIVVGNRWECAAEDEVVVIDNTCRHIDQL